MHIYDDLWLYDLEAVIYLTTGYIGGVLTGSFSIGSSAGCRNSFGGEILIFNFYTLTSSLAFFMLVCLTFRDSNWSIVNVLRLIECSKHW